MLHASMEMLTMTVTMATTMITTTLMTMLKMMMMMMTMTMVMTVRVERQRNLIMITLFNHVSAAYSDVPVSMSVFAQNVHLIVSDHNCVGVCVKVGACAVLFDGDRVGYRGLCLCLWPSLFCV